MQCPEVFIYEITVMKKCLSSVRGSDDTTAGLIVKADHRSPFHGCSSPSGYLLLILTPFLIYRSLFAVPSVHDSNPVISRRCNEEE